MSIDRIEYFKDEVDDLATDWATSSVFKPKPGVGTIVLPDSPAANYYLSSAAEKNNWKISISDGVVTILSPDADPLVTDWFHNQMDRSERIYYGLLSVIEKMDSEDALVTDLIKLSTANRDLLRYLINGLRSMTSKK